MKTIIAASVNSNSTEVIYEVVIDWLKFSEVRNDLMKEMLKFINVDGISSRFVKKKISKEHYLKNESVGQDWIVQNFFNQKYLGSGKDTLLNIFSSWESNDVYEFDVNCRRLVQCERRPHLEYCAMARCENTIYALGGVRHFRATNTALKYDLIKRSWTEFQCAVGGCDCGICLEDDKIFLIGGSIGDSYKTCQIFNVTTESLLPMTKMIYARDRPAIAIHNSSIYAIGSTRLNYEPCLLIVQRYDPREGNWSKAGATSVPGRRGAELIGNYIYSLGHGSNIIKYDVRVQKETLVIDSPVDGYSIASLDGELYIGHAKGIMHFNLHDHSWMDVLLRSLEYPLIIS